MGLKIWQFAFPFCVKTYHIYKNVYYFQIIITNGYLLVFYKNLRSIFQRGTEGDTKWIKNDNGNNYTAVEIKNIFELSAYKMC